MARAERYRARAEELRTLADYDRIAETRNMLLRVADSYEQMARQMESLDEFFPLAEGPGLQPQKAPEHPGA